MQFAGMDLTTFIRIAVEEGIEDVKTAQYPPNKEKGALEGFQKCLSLGSLEQFEAELERCANVEEHLREIWPKHGDDRCQKYQLKYWEQRWYTLQVEHMHKLLCAAWHVNRLPGYERLMAPFTSSLIQYQRILERHGKHSS